MKVPTPESLNDQLDEVKTSVELWADALRRGANADIADPLDELLSTIKPVQAQLVTIKRITDGGSQDALVKQQLDNALDTAGGFIKQMEYICKATRKKIKDAHIDLNENDTENMGPSYDGFLSEDEQYQEMQNIGSLMEHPKHDIRSLNESFKSFRKRLENEWGIRRNDGQGAGM